MSDYNKNEYDHDYKEILRRVVPGVRAKDYDVDFMDIYNLILFLIGKHVNEILGEDVINYGDAFYITTKMAATDYDHYSYSTVFCGDQVSGRRNTPLENIEEVAEYIQEIIHDAILVYSKRINEITKETSTDVLKATLQHAIATQPEYNWIMNMKPILYNAAVDKDVMCDVTDDTTHIGIYTKYVAPELLEDEINENIIKDMWRQAVGMIFIEFRQMVLNKVLGVHLLNAGDVSQQRTDVISVEDYPAIAAKRYLGDGMKKNLLDVGIMSNTPDPQREGVLEFSEIEETIIQKILQEKMQKISAG